MVKLTIRSHLKSFRHGNHKSPSLPMIVPPTWNKSQYHAALSRVWSLAAQELTEAEDIYVIGYSTLRELLLSFAVCTRYGGACAA